MTIREATRAEATDVLTLWQAAEAVPSATDELRYVEAAIESPQCAVLVAEEEGELVGALVAAWDGWRGHVHKLAVLPGRRRRGVARALLREGEAALTRLGALRVEAIANLDSPHAVGFWRTAGWEERDGQRRFTRTLA